MPVKTRAGHFPAMMRDDLPSTEHNRKDCRKKTRRRGEERRIVRGFIKNLQLSFSKTIDKKCPWLYSMFSR